MNVEYYKLKYLNGEIWYEAMHYLCMHLCIIESSFDPNGNVFFDLIFFWTFLYDTSNPVPALLL